MSDIAAWLENLGLGKYIDVFTENEIDFSVLSDLTEQDLKDLALPIGPRRKLLKAITALTSDKENSALSERVVAPVQAERRQLTVMFVDLVGSTALSGQLDPEDLSVVMRRYQRTVSVEINRLEGFVAKFMGDGVLAYFGWPRTREDEAERAVRAGLSIIVEVAKLKTPDDQPLAARIGIATGQVVVGDLIGEGSAQEETVVGETPNLAARLQGLAKPDTVVISDSTRRLLGSLFELETLGAQNLKGFAGTVMAYRVVGKHQVESRFEALHGAAMIPLVGRQQEMQLLFDCWAKVKSGKGRVVLVCGEPGIGKSRIMQALREHAGNDLHIGMRYQCSPYYTHSALYPVIEQLQYAAGFVRDDTNTDKLDKLENLLRQGTEDITRVVPLIAALLSLDTDERYPPLLAMEPQKQKEQTLQALADQVVGLAVRRPLLMLVEDVHWIDPSSQELFDLTIPRIASRPVLLVMSYRPEYRPPWLDLSHVKQLPLKRLDHTQTATMISRVSGAEALPDEVLEQLVSKTDGVPLFVEELTKTVLESGLLNHRDSSFGVSGFRLDLAIPATLQDSLMARLDRLNAVKEIAQIGACIGRTFSYALIAAVASLPENELSDALQKLIDSELIICTGTPANANYTFKHALLQDAAYNSLLKRRRQQLHQSIANHLLASDPMIAKTEPELLAHHFTAAGLYSSAVTYWLAAGVRAADQFAHEEAICHLQDGLSIVDRLTDADHRIMQEHTLLMALVQSYRTLGLYEEALAALQRAERLAASEERLQALAEINYLRGNIYYPLGDFDACRSAHQAALRFAEASGSLEYQVRAYSGLGDANFLSGKVSEAYRYIDRCIVLAQQHSYNEIEASNLHMRGICHYYQNRVGKSIEDCSQSIALALQYRQFRAEIIARSAIIFPLWDRGDLTQVLEHAQFSMEAAQRTGMRIFEPIGLMYLARALAVSADTQGWLDLARQAVAVAFETGRSFVGPWALGTLALLTDDLKERDDALAQGDEIIRSNCVRHCVWWYHRDAIEACLDSKQWDRAETYANALDAYTHDDPVPWCDYFIARGRALAAWGRDPRDERIRARLTQLSEQSAHYGFEMPKRAIERALAPAD